MGPCSISTGNSFTGNGPNVLYNIGNNTYSIDIANTLGGGHLDLDIRADTCVLCMKFQVF